MLDNPDHYPIIVNLKNLPTQQIQSERASNWNLAVPEGWKTYKELSDKIADKMNKIIETESLDIEDIKKKTDALQTKIKFQAFGKTKPATGKTVVMYNPTCMRRISYKIGQSSCGTH